MLPFLLKLFCCFFRYVRHPWKTLPIIRNEVTEEVKNSFAENCNFLVDINASECSFPVEICDYTHHKINICNFTVPDPKVEQWIKNLLINLSK